VYLHDITGFDRAKPRTTSTTENALDVDGFRRDVVNGLSSRPKTLPCKYFYDERGSQLFEQICELDEYYLTRTELSIMRKYAPQMGSVFSEPVLLVELGSGSSVKTRLLLQHLPKPLTYVPVDISYEHLYRTARGIAQDYSGVEVVPIAADFTQDFDLPRDPRPSENVVVFFPGSTIGNFAHQESCVLLEHIAGLCASGGGLIIGIDLQKDPRIIEAAYNDRRGVTAEFNLNLLIRINRELNADFNVDGFVHRAVYNQKLGRIEMYLISQRSQNVRVGDEWFSFVKGETICTEYSHKYRIDQFADLAFTAGLKLERRWTDSQELFAVLQFAIIE
jgi:dimethylhistidine N-methyltransferase